MSTILPSHASDDASPDAAVERRLLGELARTARVGAVEVDLTSGELLWTPGATELFGEPLPASAGELRSILPVAAWRRIVRAYLAMRGGGPAIDVGLRVPRPGVGDVRWRVRSGGRDRAAGTERLGLVIEQLGESARGAGEDGLGIRRLGQAMTMARIGAWTVDLVAGTLYWSDEVFRIHGMEPGPMPTLQEAIGFYAPASQERVTKAFSDLIAGGAGLDEEAELVIATGRRVWVHTMGDVDHNADGVPVRLYGVVQDVTARRNLEERLRESQERLLHALDGAKDGVWDWHPQRSEIHFSPRWKGILGLGDDELPSHVDEWHARIHEDDKARVVAGLRTALDGGVDGYREEYRVRHADGGWRWILSRGKVVDRGPRGEVERMVGTHTDVTEEIRMREEIVAAREAAEAAAQVKADFLATMSHEIRTPMNGILGMAQMLLDSELDADQRHVTETIFHSGTSLLHILNDVLDLSKFEAGEVVLEETPFDPVECARGVVELMDFDCRGRDGLTLAFIAESGVPSAVLGDGHRLRQVLLNLVGNAVKFTSEGRIELIVSSVQEPGGARLRFVVKDTGIGFDDEAAQRLFDAFTQADSSTTRRYGGTGLGLAVCKTLIELMGGTIGCSGREGSGATFWVEIPARLVSEARPLRFDALPSLERIARGGAAGAERARSSGAAPAAPVAPGPRAPAPDGATLRILVAEDTPVNQAVARRMLESLGCEVEIAENGRIAVERATAREFDLVLMDCQMPVLDGYLATHELRAAEPEGIRSLPIVAMTANAMAGDRERCLEAGMDDYLVKPVLREALAAMLDRVRAGTVRADPR
ncbi:MAG: PAS domain-containing protein [Planctomycetota bacterium]|nr:PAS domain-containing protein [Planctomycetota bacterium]